MENLTNDLSMGTGLVLQYLVRGMIVSVNEGSVSDIKFMLSLSTL